MENFRSTFVFHKNLVWQRREYSCFRLTSKQTQEEPNETRKKKKSSSLSRTKVRRTRFYVLIRVHLLKKQTGKKKKEMRRKQDAESAGVSAGTDSGDVLAGFTTFAAPENQPPRQLRNAVFSVAELSRVLLKM